MKNSIWTFVVVALVCAACVWGWKRGAERSAIGSTDETVYDVQVQEGAVRVKTAEIERTLHTGESLLASVDTVVEPTPTATPTATPTVIPNNVRVQDAGGFAIPNATVTVADRVYRATDGLLILDDLPRGTHLVQVDADDYESSSVTIQSPTENEKMVTLEYRVSFDLQVIEWSDTKQPRAKQTGPPVAGATVYLWEGPAVQRPVSDRITLPLDQETWSGKRTSTVRRTSRGVSVERIDGSYNQESLRADNRLVGLTARFGPSQTEGAERQPLRVWDSLTALQSRDGKWALMRPEAGGYGLAFFERQPWEHGRLITQSVTDAAGRCRFENLPARLYVVMVEKGNLQSRRTPILPSVRQGRIEIVSWRSNSVQVMTRRSSSNSKVKWASQYGTPRGIPDANVLMRKDDGSSRFSGKTDDRGVCTFNSIPWGEYTLKAIPPPGTDVTPNPNTRKIMVEGCSNSVRLFFDFGEREGIRISGTVLDVKTGNPISGQRVELERNRYYADGERTNRRPDWGSYASTLTESDGRFEFHPVETNEYRIEASMYGARYAGFFPISRRVAKEAGIDYDKNVFIVEDNDVENIECYVMPGVTSRFFGRVIDEDRRPLEGVSVTYRGEVNVESGRTDADGRFEVSIALGPHPLEHRGSLRATLQGDPRKTRRNYTWNGIAFSGVFTSGDDSTRMGYTSVSYLPGATVRDIEIVVEGDGLTLEGTIRTSDGKVPEFVELSTISVNQGGRHLYAVIEPDGSYRVIRLRPGEFDLNFTYFEPGGIKNKALLAAMRKALAYETLSFRKLSMPEYSELLQRQGTMQHDIVTKKTSYFEGKVVDKAGKPVAGERVYAWAIQEDENNYDPSCYFAHTQSGPEGEFLIRQVSSARTYRLEVQHTVMRNGKYHSTKTLAQIENLTPPTENIILVVDPPKPEEE